MWRQERGGVLALTVIATTVLMGAAALSVDVGRASIAKRQLQAVADVVALDAVRGLGALAGEAGELSTAEHVAQLARESAQRNGFDPDAPGHDLTVAVGTFDPASGTFTTTGDPALHNAVEVTVTKPVDWSFAPGSTSRSASAAAMVGDEAGIALGSYLARLDTDKAAVLNGLLTGILGATVSLDAAGYQGLAAAAVELDRLRAALGLAAGTPDELLDTEIGLAELLDATATALTAQGDAASLAAVTPVSTLAAAASATLELRLGDFIDVAPGGGSAALEAALNVLTLVQMAAQVADTDRFVSVTLPVVIPGVTNTTLDLALIEAPRIAIGPARRDGTGEWVTRASSAQVRAQLRLQLLELLEVLGLTGPVALPLYLEGGGSAAALTDIRCTDPIDDSEVDVRTSGQAIRAGVGVVSTADLKDATSPLEPTEGLISEVPLVVRVTGAADVTVAHSATDLTFTGPFDWNNTQTAGSTTLGLAPLLWNDLDLTVTTLTLGVDALAVESDTRAILAPVFDALDAELLDPLLSALGMSLGGGDVTTWDLWCSHRRLVR